MDKIINDMWNNYGKLFAEYIFMKDFRMSEKNKLVEIEGEEVIQLYVGFSNSSIDRPVKLLRGFKKVLLKHGEIKKVDFNLNPDDLAYYNVENKKWEIEKMKYEIYIGSSSNKNDLLKSSFVIK